MFHLEVGGVCIIYWMGFVAHLDALVLVGRDCPILDLLLETRGGGRHTLPQLPGLLGAGHRCSETSLCQLSRSI